MKLPELRASWRLILESFAFLFDLDGVFYNDTRPIPGGAAVVAQLRARERALSLRHQHHQQRARLTRREVAALWRQRRAARDFLSGGRGGRLPAREKRQRRFLYHRLIPAPNSTACAKIALNPTYVVLGDLSDDWTYAKLNQVLRYLLNGSRLIALGMSRYWHADDGPRLDVGPIASALSYATGHPPIVLGKPAGRLLPAGDARPGCRSGPVRDGGRRHRHRHRRGASGRPAHHPRPHRQVQASGSGWHDPTGCDHRFDCGSCCVVRNTP